MTIHRILVSAAVVLLTLGGCGGAASEDKDGGTPPPDAGTLVVSQSGDAPPRTIWYVRIETPTAKPVAEKGFPGKDIALTRNLKAGDYRVISWYRTCETTCPTSGEKGLGPLEQVCGAPVTIVAGEQVKASVKVGAEGCTVDVG